MKTDRRDAKKLVRLYRAGALSFVHPPTPETEGLRDLLRCREDLRRARVVARNRMAKQLLRYGRVYREGKRLPTKGHREWVNRQHLDDPLAQAALEQALIHLDGLDRQVALLDASLERLAREGRWAEPVQVLGRFRGIANPDRAGADLRDRRLCPLLFATGADVVAGDHPERVLLRATATPRAHHPRRQRVRPPAADRGRLALVRHEAPCCIPGAAGMNSKEGSWV